MTTLLAMFGQMIAWSLLISQAQASAKDDQRKPAPLAAGVDYWESYAPESPTLNAAAFEITDQVKVEDIVEAPQDYSYAAFDKPNPFALPPLSSYLSKMEVPITSVLQKYRVNKLKAVGIWLLDNQERKALITTPAAEGVVVGVGDFVGNRGGRVTSINSRRVLVREFTLTPDGNRHFDDSELWLGGVDPEKPEFIILPSRRTQARSDGFAGKDYLETSPLQKSREENIFRKTQGASLEAPTSEPSQAGSRSPAPGRQRAPNPSTNHSSDPKDQADKGEVKVNQPAHPTAAQL